MAEDKKKRPMNTQMAEAMILSKLYRDGFFVVDEEAKTVMVEMRKDKIVERYKDSSYEDIKSIIERTAKGLKLAGYEVKVRWLSEDSLSEAGVSGGTSQDVPGIASQNVLEEIQRVLEKPDSELEDGFGDAAKN